MKKNIIRVLSLFFIVAILFSSSCGQATGEGIIESEENELDLEGYNAVVYQSSFATTVSEVPFFYVENTLFSELILNRIKNIEEELNCEINFNFFNDQLNTKIIKESATGESGAEILISTSGQDPVDMAYAGLLYPLDELKHILDYENTDKYGSKGELECVMLNNIPYAVTAALLPEKQVYGAQPIGVFNGKIIKQNMLTDPREYIEQNNWTWETFEKCLSDYYIKDGEVEIKALGISNFIFAQAAILNNGTELVVKEDGNLKSGLYSSKVLRAIEWHQKILRDYKDNIMKVAWCSEPPILKDEKSVMVFVGAWLLRYPIAYEVEDFGLFPFPSGPDAEYGKWVISLDGIESLSIPLNAEDPEYASNIISKMLDPFEEYPTKESLYEVYNSMFHDERDTKLFVSLAEHARFSYFPTNGYDFANSIDSNIEKKSAAEIIESYAPQYDEVIEKYISTNYEFMQGN